MSRQETKRGTLYLVVGPSGAGKDTLLAGARKVLARDPRYYFPQRLITRSGDAGGEEHVPVTDNQFARLEADGAFALSWSAHGHRYGIPAQIDGALARGIHVVANVSRARVDEARRRFAPVIVVQVTAPPRILAQRIAARGREEADATARRLDRAQTFRLEGPDVATLVNDRTVEDGVSAFLAALEAIPPKRRAAGGH